MESTIKEKATDASSLWRDGYVAEEYTQHFCSGLNPTMMGFAALLKQHNPLNTSQSFTYCELGCGKGLTANVLAAANPHGLFYANDFNATNCKYATALAKNTGLTNIHFLEKSFEEMLSEDLPAFDCISLHGIYSWVNADNRAFILAFIKKHLKPGGLVYVSYNSATGFASFAPVQKLLTETSGRQSGEFEERQAHAFSLLDQLNQADASYLRFNTTAQTQLKRFKKRDPLYVAHELFNKNWTLFYHTDIADDFARIGLNYCALSNIAQNFLPFIMHQDFLPFFKAEHDDSYHELLADFITSRQFRADIFQKSDKALSLTGQEHEFLNTRFALITPKRLCSMQASIPIGNITLEDRLYQPILDFLDTHGSALLAEIIQHIQQQPDLHVEPNHSYIQAISKLVAVGYVQPCLSRLCANQARPTTDAMNQYILHDHVEGAKHLLVSPVLGSAIGASYTNRLFLRACLDKKEDILFYAKALQKTNAPTPDRQNQWEKAALQFKNDWYPLYRQLGVV